MTDEIKGGCACGSIRYACEGEPRYMGNCHCRDCQQATGSAYFPAVGFREESFKLEQGEPRWYIRTTDRGHQLRRAFCGDCGSPVFLTNDATPNFVVLYAGSLDDPSIFKPARDIYVQSAQPWNLMHPDLPKSDKMPEMPKR